MKSSKFSSGSSHISMFHASLKVRDGEEVSHNGGKGNKGKFFGGGGGGSLKSGPNSESEIQLCSLQLWQGGRDKVSAYSPPLTVPTKVSQLNRLLINQKV
ncbi:hypothetical protein V2J09_004990 [Rumex salicifolius]